MSNYIDISWPITVDMTSYKDSKPVQIITHKNIVDDGVADSSIACNLHTGTHIDAPIHFVKDGATVEQLSLEQMNGACRVLDLTNVNGGITADDLKSFDIKSGERLLLKTRNSAIDATAPFDYEFVYLAADGAQYLASCNIALVGIDALGIERNQPQHETHACLFAAKIIILEGLRLASAKQAHYLLTILPLALCGVEAAPARAVLSVSTYQSL